MERLDPQLNTTLPRMGFDGCDPVHYHASRSFQVASRQRSAYQDQEGRPQRRGFVDGPQIILNPLLSFFSSRGRKSASPAQAGDRNAGFLYQLGGGAKTHRVDFIAPQADCGDAVPDASV